jgi:hypothetical protein
VTTPSDGPAPTRPGEPSEPPETPVTGDDVVDATVVGLTAALARGDDRVGAFDAAHRALQDRLADVEG